MQCRHSVIRVRVRCIGRCVDIQFKMGPCKNVAATGQTLQSLSSCALSQARMYHSKKVAKLLGAPTRQRFVNETPSLLALFYAGTRSSGQNRQSPAGEASLDGNVLMKKALPKANWSS